MPSGDSSRPLSSPPAECPQLRSLDIVEQRGAISLRPEFPTHGILVERSFLWPAGENWPFMLLTAALVRLREDRNKPTEKGAGSENCWGRGWPSRCPAGRWPQTTHDHADLRLQWAACEASVEQRGQPRLRPKLVSEFYYLLFTKGVPK